MEGRLRDGLLSNHTSPVSTEDDHGEGHDGLHQRLWDESKKLWVVAAPAISTRFATFGLSVISQAYIGHIGETELAAYALVSTVILRFSLGIALGMSSALQTLCGQAYGAARYHMLGIYLQQSWILLFVTVLCLLPLFIFAPSILIFLGQTEEIAEASNVIAFWFIPNVFGYFISYTLQMYLQAQSKNLIIGYLAVVSVCLHISLSWILSSKLNLGLDGVMISMSLAYWVPNIGQLLFILCGGCPKTWTGFSASAFANLWPVVKLSAASGVMVCVELWYNSVLVLLTGNMRNSKISIDALSICLTINGWEMMISLGFLAAASVRVANELGRGKARAAKFSVVVVVGTSLAIGLVLFVFFLSFRGSVAYIFSNDKRVVKAVSHLSPWLALSILLNSVQPVLSGVAVGGGWQSTVGYVNIACYYIVGVPFGAVLGYIVGLQVEGVWIGMIFGTALQTFVLLYLTWKTDWDNQVSRAMQRVNKYVVHHTDEANDGYEPAVGIEQGT